MQTISDSNGCRQGVVASSMGTIARFFLQFVLISQKKVRYFLFSILFYTGLKTPILFGRLLTFGGLGSSKTRRFGVLFHSRGPMCSCNTNHFFLSLHVVSSVWDLLQKLLLKVPGIREQAWEVLSVLKNHQRS